MWRLTGTKTPHFGGGGAVVEGIEVGKGIAGGDCVGSGEARGCEFP
ncbi:Uncharacterised protein [Mycobacterium tuberculosis]|nr:Uncharacterised protein [Mycobacterium tuberculosis]